MGVGEELLLGVCDSEEPRGSRPLEELGAVACAKKVVGLGSAAEFWLIICSKDTPRAMGGIGGGLLFCVASG